MVACKSGLAEAKFSIWPDVPSPAPPAKTSLRTRGTWGLMLNLHDQLRDSLVAGLMPALESCFQPGWQPLPQECYGLATSQPGLGLATNTPILSWDPAPVGHQTCLAAVALPGCCSPWGAASTHSCLAAQHPKSSAMQCLCSYLLNSGFLLALRCYKIRKFKCHLQNVDMHHIKTTKYLIWPFLTIKLLTFHFKHMFLKLYLH